ncbi:MAG: hypothetical protein NVS4B8_30690 [Herpetosiphon sp.]
MVTNAENDERPWSTLGESPSQIGWTGALCVRTPATDYADACGSVMARIYVVWQREGTERVTPELARIDHADDHSRPVYELLPTLRFVDVGFPKVVLASDSLQKKQCHLGGREAVRDEGWRPQNSNGVACSADTVVLPAEKLSSSVV